MATHTELVELIKKHSSSDLEDREWVSALAGEIAERMVPREVYWSAMERIAELEKEAKTFRCLLGAKLDRSVLKGEGQ